MTADNVESHQYVRNAKSKSKPEENTTQLLLGDAGFRIQCKSKGQYPSNNSSKGHTRASSDINSQHQSPLRSGTSDYHRFTSK